MIVNEEDECGRVEGGGDHQVPSYTDGVCRLLFQFGDLYLI